MEGLDCLLKAGEVARAVRAAIPEMVGPGTSLLTIAERVEELIREHGCTPAFPCNISLDAVAAHYSPPPGDFSTLPRNSVVKVDFGVSVDGYIADTALTITDTAWGEVLKKAVEEALRAAVKVVEAGVKVSEVGAAVQNTLMKFGVKPIRNLTGHEIRRFNLHAGVSIPNVSSGNGARLEEGHVYAIEPFATLADGAGEVRDVQPATIYRLELRKPSSKLSEQENVLVKIIDDRFNGLPYSLRWLSDLPEVLETHQKLVRRGLVKAYPMLVERTGRPVAQAEHTVLVEKNGCVVIT
ncbi:MAG: type II methionyl aminopeptidase [Candidatus Caldarchaeum sp.]|nr:type II methionyl aminopeptidase [Candidatus Caldarchaeum sp.]MDW8360349.1 type II methionyl aminopeptidase [Candidatus Caldarchaeum sp.]